MNRDEYARMFAREEDLWWYRGMRTISCSMLEAAGFSRHRADGSVPEILDAGCGTGAGMQWLAQYGRVTGLDMSDDALSFCKQRGLDRLIRGSIDFLPFPTASFDIVTSFDVLCHRWVSDDLGALREFRRVLRPGGRLLLRVPALIRLPALPSLFGRHDMAVQTRHRYRRAEVVADLRVTGFVVETATYVNTALLPLVVAKRLRERLTADSPSDLDSTPRWLNAAFTRILQLEARAVRHVELPFGVSVMALAHRSQTPDSQQVDYAHHTATIQ